MKVLLTGSSGRIGRAIRQRLAAEHIMVGVDRVPAATTDVVDDLGDAARLRRLLDGVDAVIHCAALHAPHVGRVADAEFDAVNVIATERLARACIDAGIGRFVFTSTTALYGAASAPRGRAGWVDEHTVPQPRTVYHRSKLEAERRLQALTRSSALSVTVLRMGRCFPEPAPAMALMRLHRGIDARDVADAHARALEAAPERYRCLVICAATPFEPTDVHALAQDAASVIRRRAPALARAFARRSWPLPASIDRVYCARQAMRTLDWQPRYGFEAVLQALDEGSPEVLAPDAPLPR